MLTEQTKIIAELAARLLCGAHESSLLDGSAAVSLSGQTFPCSAIELAAAQSVASEVRKLLGARPGEILTDPEYILQGRKAAEDLLTDRLADTRLRILFVQDRPSGRGRAYWRCQEPARIITETYPDVRAESLFPMSESQLSLAYDAFVIQGGLFGDDAIPRLQHRITRLKEAGRIICYETDDDLDALTLANPARFELTPRTIAFIKWLRRESDVIFTTTDYLKDKLGYPEKTIVAPNSLDFSRFIHPMDNSDRENFLFVLWHGVKGHDLDLEWIRKPLLDFIINRRPKLEEKLGGKKIIFGFMGYFPEFISGPPPGEPVRKGYEGIMTRSATWSPSFYFGNDPQLQEAPGSFVIEGRYDVRYIEGLPIDNGEFHQGLINLRPDICYCPLEPKAVNWNSGKSLIKIQESILAGAAVVTTNTAPYDNPCLSDNITLKSRSPEAMMQDIQQLILNPVLRKDMVQAGDTWLRQNYDLRVNAHIWVDAIQNVRSTN